MVLKEVANVISSIGFGGAVVTAVWMCATPAANLPDDAIHLQTVCMLSSVVMLIIAKAFSQYLRRRSIHDVIPFVSLILSLTSIHILSAGIREGQNLKFVLGTSLIGLIVVPVFATGWCLEQKHRRAT